MASIYHELIIGAPAEKVYNTLTSQEGLSSWWTPETAARAEVNSIARFTFGSYYKEMKVTGLKPSALVRWNCVAGDKEWIGTNLSFTLTTADKKTLSQLHPETSGQLQQQDKEDNLSLLVFRHDDWRDYTPMYAECNYTWGQFLRSLKLFCETGIGTPWPTQHRK